MNVDQNSDPVNENIFVIASFSQMSSTEMHKFITCVLIQAINVLQ